MKKNIFTLLVILLISCNKERHCECYETTEIRTSNKSEKYVSQKDFRTYSKRKNSDICDSYSKRQNNFYGPDSLNKFGHYSDTIYITTVTCSGDGR